jgi:hypothetical protein
VINLLPGRALLWCMSAVCLVAFSSLTSFASESAQPVPIVVELFTSEGCSSCPPADLLLRKLDSSQPIAGAHLIVLEEHVDYWDDLGWKDPFSSHEFTLRQSAYADRLKVRAPYTPQMVIDGNLEVLGSDARRVQAVLDSTRSLPTVPVRLSSLTIENGKVHAHVETGNLPSKAEIFVGLALDRADTEVKRGENGGRHLEHVAVLQSLHHQGKAQAGQSFTREVTIPAKSPGAAYRVIAIIQEPDQGKIIGAAVENLRP